MNAYVTVGPMYLNPSFCRALLMARAWSVTAGTSLQVLYTTILVNIEMSETDFLGV